MQWMNLNKIQSLSSPQRISFGIGLSLFFLSFLALLLFYLKKKVVRRRIRKIRNRKVASPYKNMTTKSHSYLLAKILILTFVILTVLALSIFFLMN